jgi:scytalone dehydratase
MPAQEFLGMAFNERFLGNLRLKTQQFVGATKWVQHGEDGITGYHQMRVAHQKYADNDLKEVAVKGHAHGKATIWYRKVDGDWRFAGIQPDIRWSKYDHDKIWEWYEARIFYNISIQILSAICHTAK